jgi:Bacterial protein of unknown function (Gcw_chp)
MGGSRTLLALAALVLFPTPSFAQLSINSSVSLATPYVWRGVTRANGGNLQAEGFLGLGLARGFLSLGAWANLELGSPSPGNLSQLGPERPGWSEVDYWVQFARPLGELETTVGVLRYSFPNQSGHDGTTEVYAGVQMITTYLVPRLMLYVDVDQVEGGYAEGMVTFPLLAYPFGNPVVIYGSLLAGLNLGQDVNLNQPEQDANFRHDGITHFEASLRFSFNLGRSLPLTINLEPHWQLKVDQFTKRTSPEPNDRERNLQFWLGVSLSSGMTLFQGARP